MESFNHNPRLRASALMQRAMLVYKKYFDELLRVEGKIRPTPQAYSSSKDAYSSPPRRGAVDWGTLGFTEHLNALGSGVGLPELR